jgi:hypothetical protein
MKTIYFDESGFTGYNFLDPNQPIFAIASTTITPALAEIILKTAFPNYKAAEFKFSNIVNTSNELGLIQLGKLLRPYSKDCFVFLIDKKFATLVKMVDFLIEPATTDAGFDFYADGFCRKYANYFYIGFTVISKKNIYQELITIYQDFSRHASRPALKVLTERLKKIRRGETIEIKTLIDQFIEGSLILEKHVNIDDFKSTNDLQLTTMLAIVSWWRKKYSEDFSIVHDDSSNFLRQKEMWNAITKPDVPEFDFPLGDGTTVTYPLRVIETHSVKSELNYSVQLCDVIAGFITQNAKNLAKGKDGKQVYPDAIEAGFGDIMFDGVRPGKEFPKFPPKRFTGPDSVDFLASLIHRHEKKKN